MPPWRTPFSPLWRKTRPPREPAGTIGWFAEHEARLAWRDWLSLMTAGSRRRARTVAIGFILFACFVHGLAYLMLTSSANFATAGSTRVLLILTGTLVTAWSLMLSQALESVTRAFYARGDLELILSSPAAASRLFAVRIAAMTVTIVILALVLAGPFINVLVWLGGVHWLGGYVAIVALAMDAVAISVVLTVALFRVIGPRRTRVVAQIVAAIVGAAFAIGMQLAAIVSYGTMSRMAILRSDQLVRLAPDHDSLLWWPARAVLGEPAALVAMVGLSVAALAATIYFLATALRSFCAGSRQRFAEPGAAEPAQCALPHRVSGQGHAPQGVDVAPARPLADITDADATALPVAGGFRALA